MPMFLSPARFAAALTLTASAATAAAPIQARDDLGRVVTLAAPARRAVTLTPHATELAYAAGAGRYIAATVLGSDYPPAARALPVVGDGTRPDPERLAAARPDLLIAWQPAAAGSGAAGSGVAGSGAAGSGASDAALRFMERLGVPVYYSDPRTLAAIPDAVERLGVLFGTEPQAREAARALRGRLAALSARYAGRRPVRVFLQAGLEPVFTLSDASIVGDALRLCGGVNVFARMPALAPRVGLESVLAARPEAVIAGVMSPSDAARDLRVWQARGLPAARAGHVYGVDADALYRPGPRLVDAAETICAALDRVRAGDAKAE